MKCDCTSYCGDDLWLANGKAEPCESRARSIAEAAQLREDVRILRELHARMSGRSKGRHALALDRVLKRLAP